MNKVMISHKKTFQGCYSLVLEDFCCSEFRMVTHPSQILSALRSLFFSLFPLFTFSGIRVY